MPRQPAFGRPDLEDVKKRKDEAIEELLSARKGLDEESTESEESEETEETTEEPERKAKTDESTEQARTEDTSGGETEQSDETEGDEKPLTVEERIALMEEELKLRDIQAEKTQHEVKKWQGLAQTRAGELDYVRKNKSREDDSTTSTLDLLSEVDDTAADNTNERKPVLSEFEQDAIETAKWNSIKTFASDYPDVVIEDEKTGDKDFDPFINTYVSEHVDDYSMELGSNSPKKVRKAITALLREARLELREKTQLKKVAEARKRRATLSDEARKRKLANQASSSSGGAGDLKSRKTDKSIEEMTADELGAILKKDPERSRYQQ